MPAANQAFRLHGRREHLSQEPRRVTAQGYRAPRRRGYALPRELKKVIGWVRQEVQRWCAGTYEVMPPKERETLHQRIL